MFFNKDGKLKIGWNQVFDKNNLNAKYISSLNIRSKDKKPYAYKGIDVPERSYQNTLYFEGGFGVDYSRHQRGIGQSVIKKIFMDYPKLKSIFLYAIEWQGAVPFWHKIGGESIYINKENGMHLIELKRENML